MRYFFLIRRPWPWVGFSFAIGLVIGDCLFVVGPYMKGFRTDSLGPLLIVALGMYVLFSVGVDLAMQLVCSSGIRDSIPARIAVIAVLGAGLVLAAGEVRSLALLGVAAVFTVVVLGRLTWPIAVVLAAFTFYPIVTSSGPSLAVASATNVVEPDLAQGAPSVVVVVMDTVRADHTSAYGYDRETTPNLARLAMRGVRFERAYATSNWSLPSHASLFTGLYPSNHGAHAEHLELNDQDPTLAEFFAELGYETACFSSNAWVAPGTGMTRGFESYRGFWRSAHVDLLLLAKRVYFALAAPGRDKGGAKLITGLRSWFDERDSNQPYFLFVNLFEAHAPYQHVPRDFRRRFVGANISLRELERVGTRVTTATQNGNRLSAADAEIGLDLLDGAIAAVDSELGEILDLVGEDPIVVVVSDHGELAGEHTLYGHSNTLYEPLIRIPMVMAGGGIPKGMAVSELVSLVDIMPTLIDAAGVTGPDVDGLSLIPMLNGHTAVYERSIRAEQFVPLKPAGWRRHRREMSEYLLARKAAVVAGWLKRIVSDDGSDLGYDLRLDPGEANPFLGSRTMLDARVPEPQSSELTTTLDPLQKKVLEALGYLQ